VGSTKYRIDPRNRQIQLAEYEERNSTFQAKPRNGDSYANDDVFRDLLQRASHPRSVTAIGTVGHASSFSVISPASEEIIITASDIEHMTQGNQVIFFTEAITHRDIFGKEHLATMYNYLKLDREGVPFIMKCGLGNDLR
jgi:hypothetical protein